MIKYVLLLNKQGQTRLSRYYDHDEAPTISARIALEAEVVRRCLSRNELQVVQLVLTAAFFSFV